MLTNKSGSIAANLRSLTLKVDNAARYVVVQLHRKVTNLHNTTTTANTTTTIKQETELLLRNRVPAMHFFITKLLSIAVMTSIYVYHL